MRFSAVVLYMHSCHPTVFPVIAVPPTNAVNAYSQFTKVFGIAMTTIVIHHQ